MVLFFTLIGSILPTSASAGVDPHRACGGGRYAGFARIESPGTPFASGDECEMYGFNGGTIVPYMPNYAPELGLKFGRSDQPGWCTMGGFMSGFVPNTVYTITYWARYSNGSGTPFEVTWPWTTFTTDRYGRASWTQIVEDTDATYQFQIRTVDGTVSVWRTLDC